MWRREFILFIYRFMSMLLATPPPPAPRVDPAPLPKYLYSLFMASKLRAVTKPNKFISQLELFVQVCRLAAVVVVARYGPRTRLQRR